MITYLCVRKNRTIFLFAAEFTHCKTKPHRLTDRERNSLSAQNTILSEQGKGRKNKELGVDFEPEMKRERKLIKRRWRRDS